MFALPLAFLKVFVHLFKLHNLRQKLHKRTGDLFIGGCATTLALPETFFSLLSLSYLQQSTVLQVTWMPPCFFHNKQCLHPCKACLEWVCWTAPSFACWSCWGLSLPFYWNVLAPSGFSIFLRSPSTQMYCSTISALSLYWACQVLGHIRRIWPARSASLMGRTFFVDWVSKLLWYRQGNSAR